MQPQTDISKLDETRQAQLIENRWQSSYEVWDKIGKVYDSNTKIYENRSDWLQFVPYARQKYRVQANRIFTNMEAVINSLIANPAGINILPARDGEAAQDFAREQENYFRKKAVDLNIKEVFRMGLRNLYFGRLIILKPFWNPAINDFDLRALDPRKVRFGKYARKEPDTEFAIEEIDDNLLAVCQRFPEKKAQLMAKFGLQTDEDLYVKNPDISYKEAWIGDYVTFKYDNIILGQIKNPYWDWDGILITDDEEKQLQNADIASRRNILGAAKLAQDERRAQYNAQQLNALAQEGDATLGGDLPPPAPTTNPVAAGDGSTTNPTDYIQPTQGATPIVTPPAPNLKPYFFNYFDNPRKPYIFATILNNENSPIGRTDMIQLSAELQRGIDKRKMDIDENCEMVNGWLKVDASVMGKSDAQRMRYETKGIVYGKGVKDGVTREFGQGLPDMVFKDMQDSRDEIDNIMAATSAFRGEREGQETKAGRLALIQQSYLRLNELVQVVDYVSHETFSWFMQLAKTRYTEYHYAKWMGSDKAQKIIEIIQDDFETGSEVTITSGKTLPTDDQFKFEQAQNDVLNGFISPVDYLKIAHYDDPKDLAKNAVLYKQNPMEAVGLTEDKMPVPFSVGTTTPQQFAKTLPTASPVPVAQAPSAVSATPLS